MDRRRNFAAAGESDGGPLRCGRAMGSDHSARANAVMIRSQRSEVRGQKKKSGAAIMLALWAIFLLSALVISWALDIDARLSISGEGSRMLKAEALACSGIEVAMHPMVKPGSPNLSGDFAGEGNYQARLTGEGGR